ncbi:riboflavin kinase [Nocardia tengchongensis]
MRKFESIEEMVEAIRRDCDQARKVLAGETEE